MLLFSQAVLQIDFSEEGECCTSLECLEQDYRVAIVCNVLETRAASRFLIKMHGESLPSTLSRFSVLRFELMWLLHSNAQTNTSLINIILLTDTDTGKMF